MEIFDVIIIGGGSIGVPAALYIAKEKLKVLVIEELPSVGQGQNKKAIGGIRATHSDEAKILTCQRSIKTFSTWQEIYGDDIEWVQGGYSYVAYDEETENSLKSLLKIQQSYNLNIKWVSPEEYSEIVPGINKEGLRGATYSPEDGSASPLLAIEAFYKKSKEYGAKYVFNEKVTEIIVKNNSIIGVNTNKNKYSAKYVINAAGANAKEIGKLIGKDFPVNPDTHEGGITEPVKNFFKPMIVDLRKDIGSKNYYFYQKREGQVIFCITPDPPIWSKDEEETSKFLPMVAKRMINLYPRLKNLKVRRTWRGLYPMTPDGSPIVGELEDIKGFINAIGMCGQGYMLGPGLGELLRNIVINNITEDDKKILEGFSINRNFNKEEYLK